MLDEFVFRLLPFPGKALLLDFQAGGAVVAAAQFDNVLAKTVQGAELAPGLLGGLALAFRQGGDVAGGEEDGHMIRQRAIRGVSQLFGVGGQLAGTRNAYGPCNGLCEDTGAEPPTPWAELDHFLGSLFT